MSRADLRYSLFFLAKDKIFNHSTFHIVEIFEMINGLEKQLKKNMTPTQQKSAIQVFVDHVTVNEDNIDMEILTIHGQNNGGNKKTASFNVYFAA